MRMRIRIRDAGIFLTLNPAPLLTRVNFETFRTVHSRHIQYKVKACCVGAREPVGCRVSDPTELHEVQLQLEGEFRAYGSSGTGQRGSC